MKNTCSVVAVALMIFVALTAFAEENVTLIYKAKCSICHGANGEGGIATNTPALKGRSITAERIVTFLTNSNPGRRRHADPVPGLSLDQAKMVADYVKALK